jgi:hypothetical protein
LIIWDFYQHEASLMLPNWRNPYCLGSGLINFDEMADKGQKYARKVAQDGLKPVPAA